MKFPPKVAAVKATPSQRAAPFKIFPEEQLEEARRLQSYYSEKTSRQQRATISSLNIDLVAPKQSPPPPPAPSLAFAVTWVEENEDNEENGALSIAAADAQKKIVWV